MSSAVDKVLAAIAAGDGGAVYLVAGDLVLAEPAAQRVADALAAKAGCEVEIYRRPDRLGDLLDDLRTFSLFAPAKVLLATDTAVLADRHAVADLLDDAEGALPVGSGDLNSRGRQAASRLLQGLRLLGLDPEAGSSQAVLEQVPAQTLAGGTSFRKKRKGRGRGKKQVETFRAGLVELLEAARAGDLKGWSDSEAALLSEAVEGGFPENHSLVLAERSVAAEHPVVSALQERGALVRVGELAGERGGGWQGLELLAAELERETGRGIDCVALDLLAHRTLRQDTAQRGGAAAESTARLAAEYRKLASLAPEGSRITRALVEEVVEDRGEQDVWQLLDAIGAGKAGEALARLQRYFSSASDPIAARLSFFALLAGFCRQLTAIRGLMEAFRVPPGERSYPRFKSRHAPKLQGSLPGGLTNPVAKLHPFRLHRAYLAAGRFDPRAVARLPADVLETELRLKGESDEPDAALGALVARLASARAAPKRGREKVGRRR
ncbi:MAG: hypothetical protein AAF604_02300 [Acidobacteriota bacterium]